MKRDDLNDLSKEELEILVCEWRIRFFELESKMYILERELNDHINTQREKINSLQMELEEEKGKTITISDGAITMRADMWEALNENKALKDENTALKQRIKDLEDIGNNYEPQFAPDDDISAFNYECVKRWTTEMGCKRKIQELQDQHQQDCIKINQLHVTIDTLVDKYSRLRKTVGMD